MNVAISTSNGTYRMLTVAKKLEERGVLDRLYIPFESTKNYWTARLTGWNHQPSNLKYVPIHTCVPIPVLQTLCVKMGFNFKPRYFFSDLFDRFISRVLRPGADVFFVQSLMALHSMRRAKKLGMITVLDRTNSHVLHQIGIWEEECTTFGVKKKFTNSTMIRKSLQEYKEADYIAVLSSFMKQTFLAHGVPEKKLLLIPSGVSFTPFLQPIKKRDRVFRIVYCGLISLKKGTHYLLEAFQQLALPNAELVLIGDMLDDIAPLLSKYKGLYRSIGVVSRNKLGEYFSQGSVFILPSLEEGLAKVIIEAMGSGLPVIATPNTGAEDVMRDGVDGFIVPIRDVEALKEKILFLYGNEDLRKKMGLSAKERAREEFSEDAYAQRLITAFSGIIKKSAT